MRACGHCKRKANRPKRAIKAADGSVLVVCACGLQWVRPSPFTSADVQR